MFCKFHGKSYITLKNFQGLFKKYIMVRRVTANDLDCKIIYSNIFTTMNVKQVILMRKDLNMRKGKMCAQAAHASMKVLLDLMRKAKVPTGSFSHHEEEKEHGYFLPMEGRQYARSLTEWLEGLFTKICVSVNSEQALLEIYNKAKEEGILCSLIQDAGETEFGGVPTYTCAAIGPDEAEKLDPITGGLPLL